MSVQYDEYLRKHINGVQEAYQWLIDNSIINPLIDCNNIAYHDVSKNSVAEYYAYDEYFYGEKTVEVKGAFNIAWLHHIHNNPHHWQHWILFEDDPKNGKEYICLQMPFQYVVEMICDWWSFSFNSGNLNDIFDWYEKHKETIKLHVETRKIVEDILDKIKNKLDETGYLTEGI